jgi:cytochrome c553
MRLVGAVGLILIGASLTAAAQATSAAGNAVNGKALYAAHQCWACHGYNGETGTRLLQEDGTFVPRMLTARGFISFIRAPRPNQPPPIGSSVTMPSYGVASLPDPQATDLWAYIKTFKPTQPAVKDIPLLREMIRDGGKLKK